MNLPNIVSVLMKANAELVEIINNQRKDIDSLNELCEKLIRRTDTLYERVTSLEGLR